jgi:hypothetical protein
MKRVLVLTTALVALGAAGAAFGWGASGHRIIGVAAIKGLPDDLPAFLRSDASAEAVGEFSREPDRSRGAGVMHDKDRDPGHYVDGDDQGKVAGVFALNALPQTREDYDTALRSAGTTSWKQGYLPYSIIGDWEQVVKDFAYWRIDDAGSRLSPDPAHKAWLANDRARREHQILIDIGLLSHFVGDGSMPLHASIHHDGWGPYPNPNNYTNQHIHSPWEGVYVRQVVTLGAVQADMTPFHDCACPIEQRVGAYLMDDWSTVTPFYEMEKAGGIAPGNPKGVEFTTKKVAIGASELRDEIVLAWKASATDKVGYKPEISVADVEAGKVDPYDSLYGVD